MISDREFWTWDMDRTRAAWSECSRCDLACSRTQTVLGEGDIEAPLFVIAEAPGAAEDKTGRAMWGPGGSLLRSMFKHPEVGLDVRRDVFMTTVVACRPPRDRKLKAAEVSACAPRLNRLVTTVKPTVILLMGGAALRLLWEVGDRPRVSEWHGKIPREHWPWEMLSGGWATNNLRLVYATYHPRFVLRQPTKQKKRVALRRLKTDLRKIAPIVKLIMSRRESA